MDEDSWTLILVHSVILMVGGHYTYAEVPAFDTQSDMAIAMLGAVLALMTLSGLHVDQIKRVRKQSRK